MAKPLVSKRANRIIDGVSTKYIRGYDGYTPMKGIDYFDGGIASETFEVYSKGLKSYPYTITYSGEDIDYITYDTGEGTIVKTFNYTLGALTSIVLSGNVPVGIPLVKTLQYTGENLTNITYS
jgi:hypothetical protein